MDIVATDPDEARPARGAAKAAKPAGRLGRRLPAALALLLAVPPLLGFTARPPEPARTASPSAAWQGLLPGMTLAEADNRLSVRGYRILASGLPQLVEVVPGAGPCMAGWASDRSCERAVLQLEPQLGPDEPYRIARIRVEVMLPSAVLASDLVNEAAVRFHAQPVSVAEEQVTHPRDQPLSRMVWRLPGDLRLELAVPSLPGDAVTRWWMVIDREPAPGPATLVSLR
jgi:hypothetical protein